MWGPIIDVLINSAENLPLVDIVQPLQSKLLSAPDSSFSRSIRQLIRLAMH